MCPFRLHYTTLRRPNIHLLKSFLRSSSLSGSMPQSKTLREAKKKKKKVYDIRTRFYCILFGYFAKKKKIPQSANIHHLKKILSFIFKWLHAALQNLKKSDKNTIKTKIFNCYARHIHITNHPLASLTTRFSRVYLFVHCCTSADGMRDVKTQ